MPCTKIDRIAKERVICAERRCFHPRHLPICDRLHLMKIRVLLCGFLHLCFGKVVSHCIPGCVSAAAHLQRLSPLSHAKTTENGTETQEMLVVGVEVGTFAWDLMI